MKDTVKSNAMSLKKININDVFWSKYVKLVNETVIPYQWEALNDRIPDAEKSYAVRNFRIAAGEEKGEFGGLVFQDSDLAKWLEAVGYSLETNPDPELERTADEVVDLIAKAQRSDGYLDTYFIIKAPDKKWQNLVEQHELYCAGHMIEAAVAYYNATGKRKILDVACRLADNIDSVFGRGPGKLKGYPGHQEIELALVKLYRATGEKRYLELAQYFIDERGQKPSYFVEEWERRGRIGHWSGVRENNLNLEYNQSHLPVREQSVAVGHSVRAVYMYTAMADIAGETGDEKLMEACRRLWNNIVTKQMYITGGVGSNYHGEAFSFDYDLPNDTVYAETCASIGLIFFASRMLKNDLNGEYADVIERALYNNILASMSDDGKHFFYVNPLDVWPEASGKNPGRKHVKPVRQKWFGCACCPPNVARLLASLGQYVYTSNDTGAYIHLYIGSEAELEVGGGKIGISQKTGYPWDGKASIVISADRSMKFRLGLRIPGWCRKYRIKINGTEAGDGIAVEKGYAMLEREWKDGDAVELEFDMPVEVMQANPKVRADAGKVAIQRGPLVYCLEEADNGENLSAVSLSDDAGLKAECEGDTLGGIVVVKGKGMRTDESSWENTLYRPFSDRKTPVGITAVPYCLWGNRKPGEMTVWINR